MGVLTYLKLLTPLAFDVLRELLLPGTKDGAEKKTTVLERLCILGILTLLALLYFAAEQLYAINASKIVAETKVVKLQEKNIALLDRVDVLTKNNLELSEAVKARPPVDCVAPPTQTFRPTARAEELTPAPVPKQSATKNTPVKNRHRMLYDKLNKKD